MIRVVILSEIRLFREGLGEILARDGRLEVAGLSLTAEVALADIERLAPEVLLLDTAVPHALDLARTATALFPETKIVAVGLSETRREVLACAEAGVVAYVCREGSVDDLVESVTGAVCEELRCSRRVAAALLRRVADLAAHQPPQFSRAGLTPRERQIVELIDAGLPNKEIARRLVIEVATVKNHVHNILDKLGARSRGEAAAKVRQLGTGWRAAGLR